MEVTLKLRGLDDSFDDDVATLRLSGSYFTVGRKGTQIVLSDPSCSRVHALFRQGTTGQLMVEDQNSRNGTFVNGQKVKVAALSVGDELRMGDTLFVVTGFRPSQRPQRPSQPVPPPVEFPDDAFTESRLCSSWPDLGECMPKNIRKSD